MATTPPPMIDRPSTPPAPRFGAYHDNWEPYRCRKSARISEQRKASPPVRNGHKSSMDQPDELLGKTQAKPSVKKTTAKRTAAAAQPSTDMLLTPTKTPRKAATKEQKVEMDSVKRNIFASETDVKSTPNRKTRVQKKISGSTLESFKAVEASQDFSIFSDSCNRVPSKDESNPFYNPSEPKQLRSTRRSKMVVIPGEGAQRVEDAAGRADGMLMNFRGKTYFQRFSKPKDSESEQPDELASEEFQAKKIKPRLLFPKKKEAPVEPVDDEEADTDVDEDNLDEAREEPNTPKRTKISKTPNAPKLPDSPPATEETTRFKDFLEPKTPAKPSSSTQPLLRFKKWGSVSKAGQSAVAGTKRAAPPLNNEAKRTRASDV